jgi:hypothetical protein
MPALLVSPVVVRACVPLFGAGLAELIDRSFESRSVVAARGISLARRSRIDGLSEATLSALPGWESLDGRITRVFGEANRATDAAGLGVRHMARDAGHSRIVADQPARQLSP